MTPQGCQLFKSHVIYSLCSNMLNYLLAPKLFPVFMPLGLYTHFLWLEYFLLPWLPGKNPSYSSFNLPLEIVCCHVTSPGKKVFLLYRSALLFGVTVVGLCCHVIPLCIPSLEQTWIQFKNTCCVPTCVSPVPCRTEKVLATLPSVERNRFHPPPTAVDFALAPNSSLLEIHAVFFRGGAQ